MKVAKKKKIRVHMGMEIKEMREDRKGVRRKYAYSTEAHKVKQILKTCAVVFFE